MIDHDGGPSFCQCEYTRLYDEPLCSQERASRHQNNAHLASVFSRLLKGQKLIIFLIHDNANFHLIS